MGDKHTFGPDGNRRSKCPAVLCEHLKDENFSPACHNCADLLDCWSADYDEWCIKWRCRACNRREWEQRIEAEEAEQDALDEWFDDMDRENELYQQARCNKRCPVCDSVNLVIEKSPRSRDIDELDDWSEDEISKMDQGWNPVQDFGDTIKCKDCGNSFHDTAMDVSY